MTAPLDLHDRAAPIFAPEAFRCQMVALFFLSISLGTALSGALAKYYDGRKPTRILLHMWRAAQ